MANVSEISFWQKHADQGTLLAAVRVFQSRAERFFGAFALMRANECMLLRILDAQAIVAVSNRNLLVKLNKKWDEGCLVTQTLLGISDLNVAVSPHFTPESVAGLKRYAEKYLLDHNLLIR